MTDYLTGTLVPALHRRLITIESEAHTRNFLVEVRIDQPLSPWSDAKGDTLVYITLLECGDTDWEIVATPGLDGVTDRIPWTCVHMGGDVVANGQAVVEWTGNLETDIATYLQTMTTAAAGSVVDNEDPNWTELWL